MSLGGHTSKEIIGSKSRALSGRKLVLCITGSVAAVKSSEIARELMRHGAEVFTVMSAMAQKIIHPYLMEWATGNPVVTELTGQVQHVTLGGEHEARADLILVAPATANTIGKAAAAIDDTPVTTLLTTAIGAGIPVIIAPAMHESMYRHPIVIENIQKLESIGIVILMPRFVENKAKIPETFDIVNAVFKKLNLIRDLDGRRILITAGPTRAYLDGFRFISNPSSGKMGISIAENALNRGAQVTLVYGPGKAIPPEGAELVKADTTEEMLNATLQALREKKHDVAILCAAVSDFGPKERKMIKTSSDTELWSLELIPLPKIVENVKKVDPHIYLVGFKAEFNVKDEVLIEKAYERLQTSEMDLIVANDVSRKNTGFGTDTNEVFIVDPERKVVHIPLTSKSEIADQLLTTIKERLN